MQFRRLEFKRYVCHAVTVALVLAASPFTLWAQAPTGTETVLYSFNSNSGCTPPDGLIFDAAGNLYGTAWQCGAYSAGTAFELSPSLGGGWTETTLYSFTGKKYPNGPYASLTFDASGNLYGTTMGGGVHGNGAVFKLAPVSGGGWQESVLHSFTGGDDGGTPHAGLIFDADGNLYGTTYYGGAYNHGAVFTLTAISGGWKESVLHAFTGGADGSQPGARLISDSSGNLYGTTTQGGSCCGTVFKLTRGSSGGWKESVLHAFTGGVDGWAPFSDLVFDHAGNLYGTTANGGDTNCTLDAYGCGTVFQLTPNSSGAWKLNVLHAFTGGGDGGIPYAAVVFDAYGNLYGTAVGGGPFAYGVVFKLSPGSGGGWKESVVLGFNETDGDQPWANLIFDASGNLYGTTLYGGTYGGGVVFEITP